MRHVWVTCCCRNTYSSSLPLCTSLVAADYAMAQQQSSNKCLTDDDDDNDNNNNNNDIKGEPLPTQWEWTCGVRRSGGVRCVLYLHLEQDAVILCSSEDYPCGTGLQPPPLAVCYIYTWNKTQSSSVLQKTIHVGQVYNPLPSLCVIFTLGTRRSHPLFFRRLSMWDRSTTPSPRCVLYLHLEQDAVILCSSEDYPWRDRSTTPSPRCVLYLHLEQDAVILCSSEDYPCGAGLQPPPPPPPPLPPPPPHPTVLLRLRPPHWLCG